MLLRVVRVARCIHYTWATMHDSFLRRVTSDLYISGSYWPCARVSSHSLVVPRCDATDAMRRDVCVSTADTGAHLCTSLLCYHHVTAAYLAEGRERAACAMSSVALTTAGQAIVLFRSQTSPFLFHVGFAVLPASLAQFHLPESTGARLREKFLSLPTLRSDRSLDCASRSWCAWLESINFAIRFWWSIRRIPMIRDHRLMDSVWPVLSNKTCWIICQFYFVLYLRFFLSKTSVT